LKGSYKKDINDYTLETYIESFGSPDAHRPSSLLNGCAQQMKCRMKHSGNGMVMGVIVVACSHKEQHSHPEYAQILF